GPDGRRRGGGDAGAGRRVRRRFRRAIPSGALTPALGDALTADVHSVQPLEACTRQVAPLHRTPMSDPTGQAAIDSVLKEHRVFPPPEHFSRRANVPSRARYDELYRRSVEDPEAFWGEALRDRMNDAEATVLVTADGGDRRGAVVPLKANVDEAIAGVPTIRNVVVVRRTGEAVPMAAGRDHWWHELVESASPACP